MVTSLRLVLDLQHPWLQFHSNFSAWNIIYNRDLFCLTFIIHKISWQGVLDPNSLTLECTAIPHFEFSWGGEL